MFPEERQQKIYDMICANKSIKVTQLSQALNSSEVTIRRDLDELQSRNKIIRTHGGAMAMYSVANEVSAPELISSHKCIEEKRKIAAEAYKHISDNDTILADSSSTVYELIKLIAKGKKKKLLIITTSLLVVNTLSACGNTRVILAGGAVNYKHNNVEGHITNEIIKSLRADKSFIGINGIDRDFGYSTPRFEDAETKALIMKSSMQSFILADSTKFDKSYLARISAECDYIITDQKKAGYDYDWVLDKAELLLAEKDA